MISGTDFVTQLEDLLHPGATAFVLHFEGKPPTDAAGLFRTCAERVIPESVCVKWISVTDQVGVAVLSPERGPAYDPLIISKVSLSVQKVLSEQEPASRVKVSPLTRVPETLELQERLDSLEELLDTILNKRMRVNFQPIIRFGMNTPYAYEALIRLPQSGNVRRPGTLFKAADNARLVAWFDLACQDAIFAEVHQQGLRSHLFINMDAQGLAEMQVAQESLADRAAAHGLPLDRIVLEVTERQAVDDFPKLEEYIEGLRARGFKIAVDDAGAGYSSLHAIAQLRPDVVKIDRSLVRGIDRHGSRRSLFTTLAEYALHIGAQVLAEGIETEDELAAIIDLGVPLAQGYLLGRPSDRMAGLRREMRDLIDSQLARRRKRTLGTARTVDDILAPGYTVSPETTVDSVARKLWKVGDLESIVVLEDGVAVGQVTRNDVPIPNPDVPDSRPISDAMQRRVFRIDASTPILTAARQATAREYGRFSEDMVVERNGQFCGVISPRHLLDTMTTLQINRGKYAHPITGLPGRVTAEERCRELSSSGHPFDLVHVEIDWFQVYNDLQGVPQGDAVLQESAMMLQHLREEHAPGVMVAQLGGRGFLLVGRMPALSVIAARIVSGFDALLPRFHTAEDLRRGFQSAGGYEDKGARSVPLLRMTIVGLQDLGSEDRRLAELMRRTAPVHRELREKSGTCARVLAKQALAKAA